MKLTTTFFWLVLVAAAQAQSKPVTIRATDCKVTPVFGNLATIQSSRGKRLLLATNQSGNPAHAVGDFKIAIPKSLPDGAYRLSVKWKTGRMSGTAWAFRLGSDTGKVVEHGAHSGRWHYFYPGRRESHSHRWFKQDLAGPNPVDFAVWPNSPIATAVQLTGVGASFYIRIRDMSPSRNNAFTIESFTFEPVKVAKPQRVKSSPLNPNPRAPVGDQFTIGIYYAMPWLNPKDSFSWDYAFMDMARSGCNFVAISGNCWADQWSAIKHWDMKGVTSYGELNGYPGPGKWNAASMLKGIRETNGFFKTLKWKGEYVGDTCIGHIMTDEPECGKGLSADKKAFLRAWADLYHKVNPNRKVYVNHCDPKWYDLNEKQATCSTAPTIAVNSHRISARQQAAADIGMRNFTVVALLGRIRDWSGGRAASINYWNMGEAKPPVFKWLAARSNADDAYEQMVTAYCYGAAGFHPYMYNQHRAVSLVDKHGNGQYGIRRGFRNAAQDLRRAQGWPTVVLLNNGSPFSDRGKYSAGKFKLTAAAGCDSGKVIKVVFGKSTDGGGTWTSREDKTTPYSATFTANAGKTVIFRARAVSANGKKSIYAANMIHIVK